MNYLYIIQEEELICQYGLIVLLVIIAILVVALIALIIVGNKLRKKQTENQAQIEAAKQIMSMLL